MIELRWLERDAQNLHPATNVYPTRPRETVLQYRVLIDVIGGTIPGHTEVVRQMVPRKEWSGWMDVPKTVEPPQPLPWHDRQA